jgi:arginine/lysine/histidine transport system permease protein
VRKKTLLILLGGLAAALCLGLPVQAEILGASAATTGFLSSFWTNFQADFIKDDRWLWLVRGLGTTLLITAGATLLGLLIGLSLSLVKIMQYNGRKVGPFGFIADLYLTVIRGTPSVVQLLIIYLVVFGSVNVPKLLAAVIAFGINSGAYMAEIIRGGILSVDRGQMEAGRSLGLGYWTSMRTIVVPQATKNILPAMGNEFITLLKETAIVGYIGGQDLTKAGDLIRSQTFDAFLPLFAVAGIYLVIVMILTSLLKKVEVRLRRSDHR